MVCWKVVCNQLPFGILEIGRVSLGEFSHSPILPDHLRNTLSGQADAKGKHLLEKLNGIESSNIREVRGLGLMIGIEMKQKVAPFIKALQEKKIIALNAGMTVIRLLPPLVITYEQIDHLVDALTEVLTAEGEDG
jgi:acetylornithine/LysW-gamma-L-lysine aminotransferase